MCWLRFETNYLKLLININFHIFEVIKSSLKAAPNLRANQNWRSVVAAGGFEPRLEDISKFFSELERLLRPKNVFSKD